MIKKGVYIAIIAYNSMCYGYSEPYTWSKKKESVLRLSADFIANREKFSDKCYRDGYDNVNKKWKYSLGYGTAFTKNNKNWCEEHIKVLKWKNKELYKVSDDVVRGMVKVDKAIAKWKVKEFVIEIYDRLEVVYGSYNIEYKLDEIELVGIISLIYTIGETNFYNSTFATKHLLNYFHTNDFKCLAVRKSITDWSKISTKNGIVVSKGAQKRREVEITFITHRRCVY